MGRERGRDDAPARGRRPAPAAAADRALVPGQRVRVSGPSMVPTLRPGDRLLVHRGAAVGPGDVVLARFPDLPGVTVVKRLTAWSSSVSSVSSVSSSSTAVLAVLASDNPAAGGDSRTHGPGEVLGRVVLVVRRGRPRRVPAAPDTGPAGSDPTDLWSL